LEQAALQDNLRALDALAARVKERAAASAETSYTRKLLAAVPVADPSRRRPKRELSSDEVPSPIRAIGDEPVVAPLREIEPGHFVATHRISSAY
jgi:hypothetical protein